MSASLPRTASVRMGRRGFTLIELLVVVSIIALLISILLPSLGKAKELANRAYCAANLRGLTQSMVVYAQDGDQSFPAVNASGTPSNFVNSFATTTAGTDSFVVRQGMFAARAGSPIACLWIMPLNNFQVPPKMLLCKSDRWVAGPAQVSSGGSYYNNFQSADQISYSIAYPWSSTGSLSPYWRSASLDSTTPLMSDMAPQAEAGSVNPAAAQGSALVQYSSPNHESKGQNVSFGDNHVEWSVSPYVGRGQDNIWTVGSGTGAAINQNSLPAMPVIGSEIDTVMVPTRKVSDGTMGS